jgi:hypothetical protein
MIAEQTSRGRDFSRVIFWRHGPSLGRSHLAIYDRVGDRPTIGEGPDSSRPSIDRHYDIAVGDFMPATISTAECGAVRISWVWRVGAAVKGLVKVAASQLSR